MPTNIQNIIHDQLRTATQHSDDGGWNLPKTTEHDVELALKSLHSHRPQRLPEIMAILSRIGRNASWISDAELLEIAARSGSPIKYLRYSVARFNDWLANVEQYVSSLGSIDRSGHLCRNGLRYHGGLTTAMVLAGDEVTLAPWTLSHALLAGAPIVAKPSSIEPLSAFLFCGELIRRGARGLSLLALDSSNAADRSRVQRLIASTAQSVVFGEDETIARVYGELPFMPQHKAIPYWSGRSGVILYADADLDLAARAIIAGATEDRGNRCISTKKVFAPRAMAGALEERLITLAEGLVRGAPTNASTDIGVNEAGARARADAACGGSDVVYDRHLLIARCDDYSQLITEEAPYPAVGIRYYDGDEDPVLLANLAVAAAPARRALVIAIFTNSSATFEAAAAELHAGKVLHNLPTREWDPFKTHQAIHLCLELMRPSDTGRAGAGS